MTDDAELRARIEAQVAARRAGASKSGDVDDEELAPEAAPPSRRPHGPQSLTPARPWSRTDAPADETDASETDSSVNAGATSARPGVGPTRPWAVRQQAESPAPVEETAEPVTSDGRLQPLRPWSAGAEPVVPTANGPAPSHPDLVLRGITDSSPETEQEPANRLRGLRSLGRRRPDDDAAPVESDDAQVERVTRDRGELEEAFTAQRAEGERLAAERAARQEQEGERAAAERKATEEITASGAAVYVPDAEAVTAYAEAAAPMLDLPAADQEADGSSAQG
ncbi:MAG TPA: hypothetical protein VKB75_09730, partial [Jatrophihabitans sp.]|nr:hypothetical protein [Jatrophihabitans sp.]